MTIEFFKYQGTGNDFIILDNRQQTYSALTREQVAFLCDRRFGIGADGLMMLNNMEGYDFEMIYFNADGGESSMCGNGGRCLVQFAHDRGIHKSSYHFLAIDGPHEANFGEHNWVQLKMKDVDQVKSQAGDCILDTGSPHFIRFVSDVMKKDIYQDGRAIRYSEQFETQGINVNFVEKLSDKIVVRTYERGVEDETYSCGTGVTAAALVSVNNNIGFNRVDVETKGGQLAVEFEKTGENTFSNIWLCGPATFVFQGSIELNSKR